MTEVTFNVLHFKGGSADVVCTACLHLAMAEFNERGTEYSVALNVPPQGDPCGWCGREPA